MAFTALPSLAHSPLSEIFQAPVSPDDLQIELSEEDLGFVTLFEAEWAKFLLENPQCVPKGKREMRILELQATIKEMEGSSDTVEVELKNQLTFFRTARDKLEETFSTNTKQASEKQRRGYAELGKQLDIVAIADHLQQQTLPWQHFMHQLDQVQIPGQIVSENGAEAGTVKRAKPSARAMALTDQSSGDPADIELRAYRIDHALLSTHITMLQKEIERLEKTVQSQELAGKFLTEHNVWGILNKSSGATTTSAGSTAVTSSTKLSSLTKQSSRES